MPSLYFVFALLLLFPVDGLRRNSFFQRENRNHRDPFANFAANHSAYFNVYDFGAKGDGNSDDTAAFTEALNFASTNGGGIVFAPAGRYRIDGVLNVPKGVTLEGTYRSVPSHAVVSNDLPNFGTVLQPYNGRGNENAVPFITLKEDSTLRGVVIYYPQQSITTAPTPYPWSIDLTGNNVAVVDVECLNCWNAIRAVGAARHYIARVQGQPINIGVYIDQTYDIGRVEDVHFNPWYSDNRNFVAWQLRFGTAFIIARSDWEYVLNTFAFGYAVGYRFIMSSTGSCNGNFLGIGADMMSNASVLVEAADPWGILITNGEFTSFLDPNWGVETASPAQVVVAATNAGSVRFVNTAFWGPSHNIARVAGSGTVAFSNCIFNSWDAARTGQYAIEVVGTGNVQINSCDFQHVGNQISIASSVSGAVIVGNLFKGKDSIANNCQNSQVGLNVFHS